MRENYWIKRIESIKKYRRREKEKEIEGRSYAMKARMNHDKKVAKRQALAT